MASRGSVAKNGHVTTHEYLLVDVTDSGVKVLKGRNKIHNLPDYAHSSNDIYAKLYPDGNLQQMRFYDEKGLPTVEIAYHPEPELTNGSRDPVVHIHLFEGIDRTEKHIINASEKKKYKKYLKEFNLYDKC